MSPWHKSIEIADTDVRKHTHFAHTVTTQQFYTPKTRSPEVVKT